MIDLQADEAAMQVSEKDKLDERYFKVADWLCYTFKMPSPYGSRWVRVVGRARRPLLGERIYPVAYRGGTVYEMAPGIITTAGGNQIFLWIASDGALVVREAGRYKATTLRDLISSLSEPDYELLVLWLSNDASAALALIEKQHEDEISKIWPEAPVFNPGNYA